MISRLVPGIVSAKVRAIETMMAKVRSSDSTDSLKSFVQNELRSVMQHKQDVSNHVDIVQFLNGELSNDCNDQLRNFAAEMLSNDDAASQQQNLNLIDDAINMQKPMNYTLRLLCLYCLCSGGVKSKQLRYWRDQLARTYGPVGILAALNLNHLGLYFFFLFKFHMFEL